MFIHGGNSKLIVFCTFYTSYYPVCPSLGRVDKYRSIYCEIWLVIAPLVDTTTCFDVLSRFTWNACLRMLKGWHFTTPGHGSKTGVNMLAAFVYLWTSWHKLYRAGKLRYIREYFRNTSPFPFHTPYSKWMFICNDWRPTGCPLRLFWDRTYVERSIR